MFALNVKFDLIMKNSVGFLLCWVVVSQHALRQTPPCEQNDKLE